MEPERPPRNVHEHHRLPAAAVFGTVGIVTVVSVLGDGKLKTAPFALKKWCVSLFVCLCSMLIY